MVPVIGRMTHAEELMPLTFIPKAIGQPGVFPVACPNHWPLGHKRTLCL